jgi:hypothetical protein
MRTLRSLGKSTWRIHSTPLFGSDGGPCGAMLDTQTSASPRNRCWGLFPTVVISAAMMTTTERSSMSGLLRGSFSLDHDLGMRDEMFSRNLLLEKKNVLQAQLLPRACRPFFLLHFTRTIQMCRTFI